MPHQPPQRGLVELTIPERGDKRQPEAVQASSKIASSKVASLKVGSLKIGSLKVGHWSISSRVEPETGQ